MPIDQKISRQDVWEALSEIPDPEIPAINICELGMVRNVDLSNGVEVIITPTYTGCPAMKMIEGDIISHLEEKGYQNVRVKTVISPPWTTHSMGEEAREKLRQYGIAPPEQPGMDKNALIGGSPKACPHCGSTSTEMISQFGSTPCKSLYKCVDCLEPFDYFKCH